MYGQVSDLVRTATGENSTVVVLPTAVLASVPTSLALGADFNPATLRVAVFSDSTGSWRLYDPITVSDQTTPYVLELTTGDRKISIGRDAGTGVVGWVVAG
jgi:hypothetical protein